MKVYILFNHDGSPGDHYQGTYSTVELAKGVAAARSGVSTVEWVDWEDGDFSSATRYGGLYWDIKADEVQS